MVKEMKLTRYLYFADEVYYSLIESFNKKKSFDEVLFWAYELYFSGLSGIMFHGLLLVGNRDLNVYSG